MTQFKYLVLALATTAGAVAPPSLRGAKDAETVGDTFVTGAGTDDVGIETTNRPRPIQGRAGRPAGSTRRTGLNGLTAIILCLLPFANGLGRASRGLLPTKRPIVRKWTGRARD